MGQKNDHIAQLEGRLSAATSLVHSVAGLLGIEVAGNLTLETLPRVLARFTAAIANRARDDDGDDDDDDDDATPKSLRPFDDPVDQEIDRASAAMVRTSEERAVAPAQDPPDLSPLAGIARELDLDLRGVDLPTALAMVHEALLKIKNPGDVGGDDGTGLTKGDSFVEAIGHARQAEHHLRGEITDARSLIGRIASAMQLPSWSKDGHEILERIQHWESLKYQLRRRVNHYQNQRATASVIADELRAVLAQIVAPTALAKFLENKPKAIITPSVLATVSATAFDTHPKYERMDLDDLDVFLGDADTGRVITARQAISGAPKHVRQDLLNFINMVTLPAIEMVEKH